MVIAAVVIKNFHLKIPACRHFTTICEHNTENVQSVIETLIKFLSQGIEIAVQPYHFCKVFNVHFRYQTLRETTEVLDGSGIH